MKSLIVLFSIILSAQLMASPSVEDLAVFSTCTDKLDAGIRYGKKVIIKDFKLDIRQKDILAYGPYSVSDQYFKVDYVIFNANENPVKITAEFELSGGDEGQCDGVQFHDWVY